MPYKDKRDQAAYGARWYRANKEELIERKRHRRKMNQFTARLINEVSEKYRFRATREDWDLYDRMVRAGLGYCRWELHQKHYREAKHFRALLGLRQSAPVELCVAVELLQLLKKEIRNGLKRVEQSNR